MMNQDKCARHDVYFSNIMNMIPSKYYFPTDPEENWKQNKYHKNMKACAPKQMIKDASKKAKKAKFNPPSQQTNVELQEASSQLNQNQSNMEIDEQPQTTLLNKRPTQDIEALRQRLTERISTLREKRKADEALEKQKRAKKGKNNKSVQNTKASSSMKTNKSTTKIKSGPKTESGSQASTTTKNIPTNISYGSLLLDEQNVSSVQRKSNSASTKKGSGISGIKTLLKKAEANEKRLEELKETKEGQDLANSKDWNQVCHQAAGEKVLDNPKLLKKMVKKREKQKLKSTKEWKERLASQTQKQKQKQQTRMANIRGKRNPGSKSEKSGAGRAGFEGKARSKKD